jgi:fructokinase
MINLRPHAPVVACFGEALWDILPRGLFLGGAPLNVAYHLSRLGARPLLISALGRDFLGEEAFQRIASWAVDTRFVARLGRSGTGVVRATLDAAGGATYRIARDVAWDRIPASPALLRSRPPQALVFGTLALREEPNRRALDQLIRAWPQTWRVLDLNLREPFDRGPAIAFALQRAQAVKLNDEELSRMTGARARTPAELARAARGFASAHGLSRVCVTAGARGAGVWWEGSWFWESARPTVVRDTVGAGDAFLAAFLVAHLSGRATPPVALAKACRLGEFVAARDGATPPYALDARGLPR